MSFFSLKVMAASYYWDTSNVTGYQVKSGTWGTDNYWTTSPGTSTPAAWTSGNSAVFDGIDGAYTITVSGTQNVAALTFNKNGYTLSGGTINLSTGSTFTLGSGITATISSTITGSGGITTSGGASQGILNLTASNSHTGATNLTANTMVNATYLDSGGYYSSIGSSANTATNLILDGGILQYVGTGDSTDRQIRLTTNGGGLYSSGSGALGFTYTGSINQANNSYPTLVFGGSYTGGSNTFSLNIGDGSGTGKTTVIKTGNSTWILAGDNCWTGITTIDGGTLSAPTLANGGSNSSIGKSSNVATNLVINGGTLSYTGSSAVSCDRLFTLGTSGGTINVSGSGVLTLSNSGAAATSGTGARTFTLSGSNTGANTLTTIIANYDGSNATSLTKTGAGLWVLTGVNTYSGQTTVSAGTLVFSGSGGVYNTGTSAGNIVINNGGTVRLDRSDFMGVHTAIPVATVTINAGGTMASNGYFNTLNNLTVSGGTLLLNGGLTLNYGAFALKGTVTANGTVISNISPGSGTYNSIMIGTNTAGGQTTFDVADNVSGIDLSISTDLKDNRDAGNAAVASGLIKTGAGTMAMSGSSIYTGVTTVSAGVLTVSTLAAGGSSSNIGASTNAAANLVLNGGTLIYTGAAQDCDRLFSVGMSGGTITANGSGSLNLTNTGSMGFNSQTGIRSVTFNGTHTGDNIFAGVIGDNSGATSVTKGGAGKWFFTGDNNYTGSTNISAGTLSIGSGGTSGSVAGNIAISNFSNLIFNRSNDLTYGGVISGGGYVTKSGAGALTLSGANNYTGSMTVSAGSLLVTSSLSVSDVTVASGATLGGTGSISCMNVSANGSINPGTSGTGILTTSYSITFSSSGSLVSTLNGTTAGSGYDQVVMSNGTLTLGNATLTLILGYTPSVNDSFVIIDNAGSNAVSDTFNGIAQGDTIIAAYGGLTCACTVNYAGGSGNDIVVKVVDIEGDNFKPLGIRRYGSLDSIYVGTDSWALRFAANAGGGIKFLAADSASANQIDANLFSIIYNGSSSDNGTGTLSLLDSSIVFTRIRQQKSVEGQPFTLDYTILGSGKLHVRVSTYAALALSGGLEFRIANNATASTNLKFGATADVCQGVVHVDAASGKYDLIMAPFDLWSAATDVTTGTTYAGLKSGSWSAPAGKQYAWHFMVDFSHRKLSDSASAYRYVADYRNSDTLGFYAGMPLLEEAWESRQKGFWTFDEGIGSTIADKSGYNHSGALSGAPNWTNGKWLSPAVSLGGSDSVTVPHSADFDGADAHTIMAWIKPAATLTGDMTILKKYSSSNVGYKFTGESGGKVLYGISNGGSAAELKSATALSIGDWHHIAAKLFLYNDQDYMALYINGKLDTLKTGEYDPYFNTNSDALVIGKNFNGVVEDVRFYNENLSEQDIKAIYLKGFSPDLGMYSLRADDNNTIHIRMHGSPNNRFLPVLQIKNWWATALPTYVYVDQVRQTSGADYYAALDDNRNQLTIGFNRVIDENSVIYIEDNFQNGYRRVGETKKMYWGIAGAANEYFWVKNTSGTSFGDASANEFYMNWKMDTSSIKDGEIWQMRSSFTNPNTLIDTAVGTNLITGSDGLQSPLGGYTYIINSNSIRTFTHITNNFTYAVEESSLVRVRLRINKRIAKNIDSLCIVTRWTLYPTGQFFRYDSIYSISGAPSAVYQNIYLDDSTYSTSSYPLINVSNTSRLRGGIIYPQTYPDLATGWMSMKNSSGYQNPPFSQNYMAVFEDAYRCGLVYYQYGSSLLWNSPSVQAICHIDMHHAAMNASSIDSIENGVQCIKFTGGRALSMITGTLDSTTAGDFSDGVSSGGDGNGDGFNEMEGAYIVGASNNTVRFVLPAHGDTCRYYPAFRITNYTAVQRPEYVFLYKSTMPADTMALLEGYQFNSYIRPTTHELIIQIDSIFCDSVGIYISADKTLAVAMTDFTAMAGDAAVSLQWNTQSEENNLGFFLFRRIRPAYLDSISRISDSLHSFPADTVEQMTGPMLFKSKVIGPADTGWKQVNPRIIYGAMAGVSYGKRKYSWLDKQVVNEVQYEYKLTAVDYNNNTDVYDSYASAMPHRILPMSYELWGNYPNPFRQVTHLKFDLPIKTKVMLNVYDIRGRIVKRIIKPGKPMMPGFYRVSWNGANDCGRPLAPGPYIYRITAQGFAKSRIMILIK